MRPVLRESALYCGTVSHMRHVPRPHAFDYPLHMLYLDLDELALAGRALRGFGVERRNAISFRRRDYFGSPEEPLADAVRRRVACDTGAPVSGPVRLLTHVRVLGYVFNPVSFYYCFAPDGRRVEAVLAEITNTPWGERHAYVVRAAPSGELVRELPKAFHVSPFFDMAQRYRWRLSDPGERLTVEMRNVEGEREVFRASLHLQRRSLSSAALWRAVAAQPVMPALIHARIYLQALALWLKRTPFFPHPAKRRVPTARVL